MRKMRAGAILFGFLFLLGAGGTRNRIKSPLLASSSYCNLSFVIDGLIKPGPWKNPGEHLAVRQKAVVPLSLFVNGLEISQDRSTVAIAAFFTANWWRKSWTQGE